LSNRAFFPDKKFDLMAAFAEIEQELRTQYLIAYSSTNKRRDGAYRKITIDYLMRAKSRVMFTSSGARVSQRRFAFSVGGTSQGQAKREKQTKSLRTTRFQRH
jgi:hypothetical protein